jgi:hypothetical protein
MKKLLYIFFILTGLCAKAQDITGTTSAKAKEITAAMDSFRARSPFEKVHIQFDKPYYTLGDTIWMKAYVVNQNNELSAISKLLYVDLVNDNDSTKTSLRLPLTAGMGWGSLSLSDSVMRMGNYHIFAYTGLMRNWPNEYFFSKAISIGDALPPLTGMVSASSNVSSPVIKPVDFMVKKDTAISIQFFPEGGELVNGLTSKIAFKAIGKDGLSREVAGYVVDKDNKKVIDFTSEHAGMGTLTLKPATGNHYTAVIKFADNSEKRVNLPKVIPQGYSLAVTQITENVIVNINASRELLNSGEILLIAQANNTVYYSGKKELINTGFTATIPKNRLPEGILQLTLLSPGNKPVAERLVFVRNANSRLTMEITPEKDDYKPRDKVHLDLQVMDEHGTPVTGAFSLAITDDGKVPVKEADEKTIFSNLLLTADLKGFVEHPNYYFTDINADKDRQLDNLLLTQGWRRFAWADILANKIADVAYQSDEAGTVSGKVLTAKGLPVPQAKVYLLFNTDNGLVLDTVADAAGRFKFTNLALKKESTFSVSATDAKNHKNLKVVIDRQSLTPITFPAVPDDLPLAENLNTYLQSSRLRFNEMQKAGQLDRSISLKEVVINDSQQTVKDIALRGSINSTGPADAVLTFVDLADNCPTLAMCLTNKLLGLHINRNEKNAGFSANAVIVVNGMYLSADEMAGITPDMISGIELITGGKAAVYKNPRSIATPTQA